MPGGLMALKNLPWGGRLDASAANSLTRAAKAAGVTPIINSAWRSDSEQHDIFAGRYVPSVNAADKGPFGDRRGPYLGKYWKRVRGLPVAIPGTSKHNKGLAVDLATRSRFHTWLISHPEYGFIQTLPTSDPPHFEYEINRDRVRAKIIAKRDAARRKVAAVRRELGPLGWAVPSKKRRQNAQGILGVTPDGIYGPKTKTAWRALTAAAK